jgi:hypothetical protein
MIRRRNLHFVPGLGYINNSRGMDPQSSPEIKALKSKPTMEMIEKVAPNVLDGKAMKYIQNRISTIESQDDKAITIQRKVKKDTEKANKIKSGKGLKILK